jgi:hypothetical protein
MVLPGTKMLQCRKSEHQGKRGKPDATPHDLPGLRYGAGTVPVRTRTSRVLCGERSGALYICSKEKTHHGQCTFSHEIRKQLVKWARLIPYAFLLQETFFAFSRLRRVVVQLVLVIYCVFPGVNAALGNRVSHSARKMAFIRRVSRFTTFNVHLHH